MNTTHKLLACAVLLATMLAGVSADIIDTLDVCTDMYELGASENYTTVAATMGYKESEIRALNPGVEDADLHTELLITVPAQPPTACCGPTECVYKATASDTYRGLATTFDSRTICVADSNPGTTLAAGVVLNAPCGTDNTSPCPYALCGVRVTRGDTWAKLAAQRATTASCLQRQNPGKAMTVGTTIKVPCKAKPSYSCNPASYRCVYWPKAYDTYESIAATLCTTIACVKAQNPGIATMTPGVPISVPCVGGGFTSFCPGSFCRYTTTAGDTADTIAPGYNTTANCLKFFTPALATPAAGIKVKVPCIRDPR